MVGTPSPTFKSVVGTPVKYPANTGALLAHCPRGSAESLIGSRNCDASPLPERRELDRTEIRGVSRAPAGQDPCREPILPTLNRACPEGDQ
jgi:hypothetical protein